MIARRCCSAEKTSITNGDCWEDSPIPLTTVTKKLQHVNYEKALKEKVRVAGLADRILFVGEHTNINDWYRALDLFVAPQRWEGFGLTPLEAMATGVPVVAADVGAFSEQLASSEAGLLISTDDIEAMAGACAAFMDDPARLYGAGARAHAHATQRFGIAGEAQRLGDVYKTVAIR